MIWKTSRGSLNVLYFEHTYFAKYKFRLSFWWSPLPLNCCFTHFFSQIWQSRNSLAPSRKFLRGKSLFLALPKWTLKTFLINFEVYCLGQKKYFNFFQRTPNSSFTFHLVYFHLAQTSNNRNKVSLLFRFFDCPLFICRATVNSLIVTENARVLWRKTKWKPNSVQSSSWPSCDWHLRN